MKVFILSMLLLSVNSFAQGTRLAAIQLDKPIYLAGESAQLKVTLFSKPENPNFQFDVVGRLKGLELSIDRLTDFSLFSTAAGLVAGEYLWEVDVVLQDAR